MAEEESRRNKRVQRLKRGIVVLLLTVILLPAGISIFLAVQVMELKNEVSMLRTELTTVTTQNDNRNTTAEQIPDTKENSAVQDIETLENRIVWDNMAQNSQPWDSGSGIRKVYLTFDDGPSANTDTILDILDEYGVKATFFVVGKEGYNDQYKRIVQEGHSLGMHSYSHKYQDIYQSVDAYREDLMKLHTYLYELTGVDSRIVRFPGGSSNTISGVDMQELIGYLSEENIVYYDWNVSSGDAASGYVSAQRIVDNVLNHIDQFRTAIVLMHDASDKNTTVEALPIIIEKILESENTVLLPISEDTVPIQHVQAE